MSYRAYNTILCPSTKFQSVIQNAQNNKCVIIQRVKMLVGVSNITRIFERHENVNSECATAISRIRIKSWMQYEQFCYRQIGIRCEFWKWYQLYAQSLDPPHVRFAITVHEITPHDWNMITQSLDTAFDISHSQFIFIR